MAAVSLMSNEFKNILVPLDDSKYSTRALNKAITLANVTDATITLAHVISYSKSIAKVVEPYENTLTKYVNKFMSKAKKYAEGENVNVDEKILYGSTSKELLKFMNKRKFDLVVMGRRGRDNPHGSYIGSVSNALVQRSNVPVLVTT